MYSFYCSFPTCSTKTGLYEGIREDVVIVKNRFFEPEFDYENLKSLLRVN